MLRSVRLIVLAAAALLFFGLPSAVRAYTDWLWFHEVQFPSIFATMWTTRLGLGTIVFLAVWGWLFLNLRVALQTLRFTAPFVWTGQQGVQLELPGRRQLQRLALIATAVVSVPIALIASGQWLMWLAFRHAVPFGTADPILGHDIGFYTFTLPVLELASNGIQALVILAALGSGAAYVLAGALGLAPTGGLIVSRPAQRHLALLVALFFLTLAFGAWLDRPRALLSDAGIVYGASYADVNARFPVAAIRIVVALAGAAVAVVASVRRFGLVFLAAGVYFAIVLGGGAYAAAIQRFVVAPNEQTREAPYIGHHIAATRFAFGLHNVDDRELSGDARLTAEDIARNGATFRNVRLWDHQPLLDTFGQLQEIRPYYDFHSVDNDRYTINGEYRQVMLSARELNSDALQNRSWINEHLTFTHGYGLTLGPVNQVTEEGLPVLFVRDLPPVSTVDLPIKEPSVYFGELSNEYVLVRSQAKEFHYPSGEDNVTTQYTGRAGVPMGSFLRRALFAMRFRAQQIVFSSDVTADTRILFHRRVDERVRRIAPFLWYDDDPYLVVHDGRLVWIQDAYTFSRNYPYSRPSEEFGVSYVRNSVKVTIDAYDGSVLFYLADPSDPVAATFSRVFPDLFRPLSTMPASLRQHLRYPEQLFQVQTAMYSTFHMTNPVVFYNKEDQWEIPVIDRQDGQPEQMQPYYTIMKLPGETGSEFIQMVPLTPRRKDNLAAWMVARSDAQHYGRLMVFRFPKQKVVFGPRQVVARINQDQVISPQITLWNQQGSQVVQGTLLVVPVEESLVYIRPLYLRAQGGKIPELKRVIVAYQNTIVMEPTLEAGLDRIFGQQATAAFRADTERLAAERGDVPAAAPGQKPAVPAPQAPQTLQALAAQARDHYQRAIQAQKAGNWAQYGQEIEALGRVIEQMRAQGAK